MSLAQTVWKACDNVSPVFFSDDAPAADEQDSEEAAMDIARGF